MVLPAKQKNLLCLQKANTKLAVLRDICLKIGVKLVSREYNLDNDVKLAQNQQKNNLPVKGGKKQQVQENPASQEDTYESLPFHASDFAEVFPVIKHLELQNNDVRSLMASAKQAYKEGAFERAFDLYSQCINALLQVTGPMNKEVAACIGKLASIQFKFGDFLQAIDL